MFLCIMVLAGAFSRFYKFEGGTSNNDIEVVDRGLDRLIFVCIAAPILLTIFSSLF